MNQICDTGIGIVKRNEKSILHLSFSAPACLRFRLSGCFSCQDQAESQSSMQPLIARIGLCGQALS